jgi:hypothetical protein
LQRILTGSVVGEVKLDMVAAVEAFAVLDAGVVQLVVAGVLVGSELRSEVEILDNGTEGQAGEPLALGVGAGKNGSRGSGCESEDDGGELHLDGDGIKGWLVDGRMSWK